MYTAQPVSTAQPSVQIAHRSRLTAIAALVAAGLVILVVALAVRSVTSGSGSSLPQYRDTPPAQTLLERPATLEGSDPAAHALLPAQTVSQPKNQPSAAQRMANLRVQHLVRLGR